MSLIKLSNSKLEVIVDDDIADYINQEVWKLHSSGYACRMQYFGHRGLVKTVFLHRIVNQTPDDQLTDHINHDKLDNRRENLRAVSHQENMANREINSNNKSGYKGVHWNKHAQRVKRWNAAIGNIGKAMTIGNYHTPEEAALAYDCAAIQLRGDFAKLNLLGESPLVS